LKTLSGTLPQGLGFLADFFPGKQARWNCDRRKAVSRIAFEHATLMTLCQMFLGDGFIAFPVPDNNAFRKYHLDRCACLSHQPEKSRKPLESTAQPMTTARSAPIAGDVAIPSSPSNDLHA
jgi:hypothetical protein